MPPTYAFLSRTLLGCFLLLSCRHQADKAVLATPGAPGPVVVPAGSTLAFRTAEDIDSDRATPNRAFAGVVSRDVNGSDIQDALPSGSPASLVLIPASATAGSTQAWELGIVSVMLNGDSFLVRNPAGNGSATSQEGTPAPARLGKFLGGVRGTLYGSPTFGASASSATLSVAGPRIWIPSGSLITFRLEQDILLVNSVKRRIT